MITSGNSTTLPRTIHKTTTSQQKNPEKLKELQALFLDGSREIPGLPAG